MYTIRLMPPLGGLLKAHSTEGKLLWLNTIKGFDWFRALFSWCAPNLGIEMADTSYRYPQIHTNTSRHGETGYKRQGVQSETHGGHKRDGEHEAVTAENKSPKHRHLTHWIYNENHWAVFTLDWKQSINVSGKSQTKLNLRSAPCECILWENTVCMDPAEKTNKQKGKEKIL